MKAIITVHNKKPLEKESSQQADSNLSFIKQTYFMETQQKAT